VLVSNRRRRQQQLTKRKRAWYRNTPGVIAATALDAAKRRRPSRRATAIGVALLLAAGATTTGLVLGLSGGGYHPVSFRIIYRVEDATTTPHTITTQILDVRRPLYAAFLTHSGPPPGQTLTSGSVENRNYIQVSSDKGAVKGQELEPDIATAPGADLRLEPALGLAAAAGSVKRGGTKQVAGRTCTEYESHDPLDSGNWKLPAADGDVTSCVDNDGHLLSDVWFIHDKLVRSRTAVSFVSNPKPLPAPLLGVDVSTGSSPLGITSAPLSNKITFATAIPAPPSGFRQIDARLVGYTDPQSSSPQAVGRDILYSNGDDAISVREQRSLSRPINPPTGPTVDLPGLGTGHWSYTPQGLAITVQLDQATQVRVLGTVSRDALLAFTRSIRKAAARPGSTGTPGPAPS
jgi:hypothetical protein